MPSTRRYDLDWLRIAAVFLLVPFHSALIFSQNPNSIVYIKDWMNSAALIALAGFLNLWHMPLLFVIAGASTWFALAKRQASQYMAERVRRLLIPAIFGMLTLVPVMTYLHYLIQPVRPSFWSHYLGYFRINLNDMSGVNGGWTPAHLWFILFLFLFSWVGLSVFIPLRKNASSAFLAWFGRFFSRRGGLLWLFFPLLLTAAVPILADKNPLNYFLWFFLGFLLVSDERIQAAIDRDLGLYAALSLLATAGYFWFLGISAFSAPGFSPLWILSGMLFWFGRWVWVLAILGAGHRWLNAPAPALAYCAEAAFPFYILHLPINTLVGMWVIRLALPVAAKYALIVLLASLASLLVYELLVRRVGFLRFLLGVKPRQPAAQRRPIPAPVSR